MLPKRFGQRGDVPGQAGTMLSRNGDTNAALKVVSELVSQRRLQDEVTGGWRGFNEYRARLCHRHAAALDHELPQQRLAIMTY